MYRVSLLILVLSVVCLATSRSDCQELQVVPTSLPPHAEPKGDSGPDPRAEQVLDLSFPVSMSPPAARAKFERAIVQLRQRQRTALIRAAGQLESEAMSELTLPEQELVLRIAQQWTTATDVPTALQHAAQVSIDLPRSWRLRVDQALFSLHSELELHRQAKLNYRDYLSGLLAQSWPSLTVPQQRQRLMQWAWLVDEHPDWLLNRRPLNVSYPLHATAQKYFDSYEQAERRLAAQAYAPWPARLADLKAQAKQVVSAGTSSPAGLAAGRLIALLEAPYGQGLRGLMLIEVTNEHEPGLKRTLARLAVEIEQTMDQLERGQSELLGKLDAELQNLLDDLLQRHRFKEAWLIERQREQAEQFWKPLRIYAQRDPGLQRLEAAYLVFRRGDLCTVEFLIDGQIQTVPRKRLWLFPEEAEPQHRIVPCQPERRASDGQTEGAGNSLARSATSAPGVAVTARMPLDGQVLCHTARSWQPVTVVDESPFGVEILWQNSDEPLPVLQQRQQLRVVR